MKGVVASGHPRVTEAACQVLHDGGNAFDAAVAAGFASAVAEPALTSLGGGGFLLARSAEGRAVLFDFFVDTPGRGLSARELEPHFLPVTVRFPGSDQVFNTGLGSVAVPGTLRGLLHVQRRLGRLPLAEVVAPAAGLAREGLRLEARQAYFLELLQPIMTLTPAGRALFEPRGSYLSHGDRFANPELADLLEELPNGGEREFYEGRLATRIGHDMHEGRGLLTKADLAAYRVIERKPLVARYRGVPLLTNPPPSWGGSLLALSLRLLEASDAGSLGFGSSAHLSLLTSVMIEVDRCRAAGHWGPDRLPESVLHRSLERVRGSSGGTTHVSVWDSAGNAASMTTSNGEGSGYVVPGTGIMLNNMMGEDDLHPEGFHASPSGLRVASMMSPSLLLDGGRVRLVVGSGGSKRIRTALLQVVSDVVDFSMSVQEAVDAPRLHWDGECVQVEPGFDEAVLAELRRRWPVNLWSVHDVYFGGVHAVQPEVGAAGDGRRGGAAAVAE
jgi:gamma-glutamyltranspeptidase/glutathione hydrolase